MFLKKEKRVNKSQTAEIEYKEPELKKPILFLLSSTHNLESKQLLKNLYQICKLNGVFRLNKAQNYEWRDTNLKLQINQKNHRLAEATCNKIDCGLYIVASSNKKRPITLGLGRVYNGNILDCCQLKATKFIPIENFKKDTVLFNSRPLVIAQGSEFGQDSGPLHTVRNILLDIFRGPTHPKLSLNNIEHAIVLTLLDPKSNPDLINSASKSTDEATTPKVQVQEVPTGSSLQENTRQLEVGLTTERNDSNPSVAPVQQLNSSDTYVPVPANKYPRLLFRRYSIKLLKGKGDSEEKLPSVKLEEIGPSVDFEIEEVMIANEERYRDATALAKKPKKLVAGVETEMKKVHTKRKNVHSTALGNLEGKVYVNRQDLDDLYTPHTKKKLKRNNKHLQTF